MVKNVNSITLRNTTYQEKPILNSVNLDYVPWENNDMTNAFINCQNLNIVTNISASVNKIDGAFYNCVQLESIDILPNSIISMVGTFEECVNLATISSFPTSLQNVYGAFKNCSSFDLIENISIPNSVDNIDNTFENCTALTNAPIIPDSVNSMGSTFRGCSNLQNAPVIPNSVTNMTNTFTDCEKLENISTIPDSVNIMVGTFRNCVNLYGDIYIESENISNISNIFNGTTATKNVYIYFKNDGVNTTTYETFNEAGYSSTTRSADGVMLMDNTEIQLDGIYEYEPSTGDIVLYNYIGSDSDITTPKK